MRQRFDREALRSLRLERDLSLEHIAVATDRGADAIRAYETGRNTPPISVLLDIATALEVPVARFFVDIDDSDRVAVRSVGAGAA